MARDGDPFRRALFQGAPPLVTAHRGATRLAAPNTAQAIEHAVDLGVDAIEVDVRTTLDGVPVLHHDAELGKRAIRALSLDRARARAERLGRPLATLEDALQALGHHAILDVEIKDPGHEAGVLEPLVDNLELDRFLVTSFQPSVLDTVRRHDPRLVTGLILGRSHAFAMLHRRSARGTLEHLVDELDVDVLIAHATFLRLRLVGELRRHGRPIHVWTVNRRRPLRRILANPLVAGVITDRPGRALTARDATASNTVTSATQARVGVSRVASRDGKEA